MVGHIVVTGSFAPARYGASESARTYHDGVADVVVSGDSSVDARVGDTVLIRLPENATTGYVWSARLEGAGIALIGEETQPADSEAPGAAGERRFRVRVTGTGPAEIVLQRARVWEPHPVEERRVTLRVRR